ncbi:hypothetical protein ACFVGY_04760 [Streptomyces sp. NPDC127106]|uniref:hypothetical protein n=1 Tax=Streptomyces sp. NPDC127106 TaxID=3345360 RepID=UPI003624B1B9
MGADMPADGTALELVDVELYDLEQDLSFLATPNGGQFALSTTGYARVGPAPEDLSAVDVRDTVLVAAFAHPAHRELSRIDELCARLGLRWLHGGPPSVQLSRVDAVRAVILLSALRVLQPTATQADRILMNAEI